MGDRRHKVRRDKKRSSHEVEDDADDVEAWTDSRHFFGRNGHTFRRNACNLLAPKNAATLERKGGPKCLEATQPTSTTDIDHFFDAGFCSQMFNNGQSRPLKDADTFDSVVESLEELAVRKSVKYSRFKGEEEYIYDVPISGQIITEFIRLKDPGFLGFDLKRKLVGKMQEKSKRDLTRWPFLFDKFWDPGFLYLMDPRLFTCAEYYASSMISPLIPMRDSDADVARTQLGIVDNGKQRIVVQSYSGIRDQRNHQDYLEIDLGHLHEITHIGTFGGYPDCRKIKPFPRYDDPLNEYKRNKRWRYYNYLYTVQASQLGWITEYSVQYRHPVTRKWSAYPQHFIGNSNICDEVVNSVSLQTRYLRIIPRAHHQHLDYTALIYGHRIQGNPPKDRKNNKKMRYRLLQFETDDVDDNAQQITRRNKDEVEVEKIETVRYTLCANTFQRYCVDGACCSCQRRNDYEAESPWQIRDFRRRIVKEDSENWRETS